MTARGLLARAAALAPCFFAANVLALGLGVGCAQSEPVDLTTMGDPTVPSVDASWNPSPGKGAGRGSNEDDEPQSEDPDPSETELDAGKDAKPVQSGSKPSQGEVLITEVMFDPSGEEPASEWIEVHNTASSARTLSGLVLSDGAARTHTIGSGVTIAPGAYVLLVRSKTGAATAKVPAAVIAYEYGGGQSSGGVQLANGSTGSVALKDGSTVVAQAKYGSFNGSSGASVQMKTLTFASGTNGSAWCASSAAWTSGSDKGTPGAAHDCQ